MEGSFFFSSLNSPSGLRLEWHHLMQFISSSHSSLRSHKIKTPNYDWIEEIKSNRCPTPDTDGPQINRVMTNCSSVSLRVAVHLIAVQILAFGWLCRDREQFFCLMSGPADPVACYVSVIHFCIKVIWYNLVMPVGWSAQSVHSTHVSQQQAEASTLPKIKKKSFPFAFTQISSNLVFVDVSQVIKPKLELCPTWKCKTCFHFITGTSRWKKFSFNDIGEEYFISLLD